MQSPFDAFEGINSSITVVFRYSLPPTSMFGIDQGMPLTTYPSIL
jgi:hypothetical protein